MTLLWLAVAVAFVTGGTAACVHAGAPSDGAFWTAVIATGIGFAGLWLQARRDAYSAGLFFCALGSFTGLIAGAIALFGRDSHPVAEVLAVLGCAGMVAGIVFVIWLRRRAEVLPNFLRETFGDSEVLENGGLQFVAIIPDGEIEAGERLELRFVLQNCWDAVRKGRFVLTRTKKSPELSFCGTLKLEVPPLAIVEVCLPVVSQLDSVGPFSLAFGWRGFGSGGRRLRHWRGRHFDPPVSKGTQIVGAMAGVITSGGGWRLNGEVLDGAEQSGAAETADAVGSADPEVRVRWQPEGSAEIVVEAPGSSGRDIAGGKQTTAGPPPPKSFGKRYGAFIATGVVVGVLAVLVYLSTAGYQSGVALDEARQLESGGDLQGAITAYEQLVSDYPNTDAAREVAPVLTRHYCAAVRDPLTHDRVADAERALGRFGALKFQAREAAATDMGAALIRWLDQLGDTSAATVRASLQLLDRSGSILDRTVQQELSRRRAQLEGASDRTRRAAGGPSE